MTLNTHLTNLSAMALIWFEKQYSCRPSCAAVIEAVPVDSRILLCSTFCVGSVSCEASRQLSRKVDKNEVDQPRNQYPGVLRLLLDTSLSSMNFI
jgi:hypothetical protein